MFGAAAGGVTTAVGLWIISGLFEPVSLAGRRMTLFLVVGFVVILRAMGAFHLLPQAKRQVPTSIFEQDFRVAAFGFGFELGTGVRTYLSSLGPYAVALGVVLLRPSFATSVMLGLSFGLGRWSAFRLGPARLEVKEGGSPSTTQLRLSTAIMSGAAIVGVSGLAL